MVQEKEEVDANMVEEKEEVDAKMVEEKEEVDAKIMQESDSVIPLNGPPEDGFKVLSYTPFYVIKVKVRTI